MHAKYSVVKHLILFTKSLLAVKHIAAQIFTRSETCHFKLKGFHPLLNSSNPFCHPLGIADGIIASFFWYFDFLGSDRISAMLHSLNNPTSYYYFFF